MQYVLENHALKALKKYPKDIQKRIIEKLDYFSSQKNPLLFAEPMINYDIGSYRFRVGDYRIIFDVINDDTIAILKIGHRREVYK